MGGLSHYLPNHNSFDFSFIFEATLGTLEAIVYEEEYVRLQSLSKMH